MIVCPKSPLVGRLGDLSIQLEPPFAALYVPDSLAARTALQEFDGVLLRLESQRLERTAAVLSDQAWSVRRFGALLQEPAMLGGEGSGQRLRSLLVAVALGLYVSLWPQKPSWMLVTALGLVAGGAVGNLIDRVRFNGVRDFLHWNYLFDWPVFNVADVFLVVGAGLILLVGIGSPAPVTKETGNLSENP